MVPPLLAAPVGCTMILVALAAVSDARMLPTWARQAKASLAFTLLVAGVTWAAGQLFHDELGALVLVVQLLALVAVVLVTLAGRGGRLRR